MAQQNDTAILVRLTDYGDAQALLLPLKHVQPTFLVLPEWSTPETAAWFKDADGYIQFQAREDESIAYEVVGEVTLKVDNRFDPIMWDEFTQIGTLALLTITVNGDVHRYNNASYYEHPKQMRGFS